MILIPPIFFLFSSSGKSKALKKTFYLVSNLTRSICNENRHFSQPFLLQCFVPTNTIKAKAPTGFDPRCYRVFDSSVFAAECLPFARLSRSPDISVFTPLSFIFTVHFSVKYVLALLMLHLQCVYI